MKSKLQPSDLLGKVRRIEIKARGLSEQVFAGQYQSAFRGRGMAFSEVRGYQIGDDVRDLDWNVTARYAHPFVKVFEEERELTVMLLVDMTGSTDFGTRVETSASSMPRSQRPWPSPRYRIMTRSVRSSSPIKSSSSSLREVGASISSI